MADESTHIHDIIIVGAGPSGLALAARLHEKTPSALFTDSEHQRYHWMRSSPSSRRASKPIRTSRCSHTAPDRLLSGFPFPCSEKEHEIDLVVLDAKSNEWLSAWNTNFADLNISHLRSPMFFHPDPRDRDGLLSFAYRDGKPKDDELREIKGVIGKELSKHQRKEKIKQRGKRRQETSYLDERQRHDYFRPSQRLFKSYCEDILQRYKLEDAVEKSQVSSISYDTSSDTFTLLTSTGLKKARIVVLATGSSSKPCIPSDSPFLACPQGSVSHAFSHNALFPPQIKQKLRCHSPTTLAVVGGGLTSAQVIQRAMSSGYSKVYHLIRGPLKTKHFDVDLNWVGKYKNFHLAAFWSADDDKERLDMITEARGGGSVNPEYRDVLKELVEKGRVVCCENTQAMTAEWDQCKMAWRVRTEPRIDMGLIDHVVYATGVPIDFMRVEMIKSLLEHRDIECVGGMPRLTENLMWDSEMPLFVAGRLAGLKLGPAAGNLEGARQGAERIAWKIGELLKNRDRTGMKSSVGSDIDGGNGSPKEIDSRQLGLGMENQFGILAMSGDEN